jgi:hypothetical protein
MADRPTIRPYASLEQKRAIARLLKAQARKTVAAKADASQHKRVDSAAKGR